MTAGSFILRFSLQASNTGNILSHEDLGVNVTLDTFGSLFIQQQPSDCSIGQQITCIVRVLNYNGIPLQGWRCINNYCYKTGQDLQLNVSICTDSDRSLGTSEKFTNISASEIMFDGILQFTMRIYSASTSYYLHFMLQNKIYCTESIEITTLSKNSELFSVSGYSSPSNVIVVLDEAVVKAGQLVRMNIEVNDMYSNAIPLKVATQGVDPVSKVWIVPESSARCNTTETALGCILFASSKVNTDFTTSWTRSGEYRLQAELLWNTVDLVGYSLTAFSILSGSPHKLLLLSQPPHLQVTAGEDISPFVKIGAEDIWGNEVLNSILNNFSASESAGEFFFTDQAVALMDGILNLPSIRLKKFLNQNNCHSNVTLIFSGMYQTNVLCVRSLPIILIAGNLTYLEIVNQPVASMAYTNVSVTVSKWQDADKSMYVASRDTFGNLHCLGQLFLKLFLCPNFENVCSSVTSSCKSMAQAQLLSGYARFNGIAIFQPGSFFIKVEALMSTGFISVCSSNFEVSSGKPVSAIVIQSPLDSVVGDFIRSSSLYPFDCLECVANRTIAVRYVDSGGNYVNFPLTVDVRLCLNTSGIKCGVSSSSLAGETNVVTDNMGIGIFHDLITSANQFSRTGPNFVCRLIFCGKEGESDVCVSSDVFTLRVPDAFKLVLPKIPLVGRVSEPFNAEGAYLKVISIDGSILKQISQSAVMSYDCSGISDCTCKRIDLMIQSGIARIPIFSPVKASENYTIFFTLTLFRGSLSLTSFFQVFPASAARLDLTVYPNPPKISLGSTQLFEVVILDQYGNICFDVSQGPIEVSLIPQGSVQLVGMKRSEIRNGTARFSDLEIEGNLQEKTYSIYFVLNESLTIEFFTNLTHGPLAKLIVFKTADQNGINSGVIPFNKLLLTDKWNNTYNSSANISVARTSLWYPCNISNLCLSFGVESNFTSTFCDQIQCTWQTETGEVSLNDWYIADPGIFKIEFELSTENSKMHFLEVLQQPVVCCNFSQGNVFNLSLQEQTLQVGVSNNDLSIFFGSLMTKSSYKFYINGSSKEYACVRSCTSARSFDYVTNAGDFVSLMKPFLSSSRSVQQLLAGESLQPISAFNLISFRGKNLTVLNIANQLKSQNILKSRNQFLADLNNSIRLDIAGCYELEVSLQVLSSAVSPCNFCLLVLPSPATFIIQVVSGELSHLVLLQEPSDAVVDLEPEQGTMQALFRIQPIVAPRDRFENDIGNVAVTATLGPETLWENLDSLCPLDFTFLLGGVTVVSGSVSTCPVLRNLASDGIQGRSVFSDLRISASAWIADSPFRLFLNFTAGTIWTKSQGFVINRAAKLFVQSLLPLGSVTCPFLEGVNSSVSFAIKLLDNAGELVSNTTSPFEAFLVDGYGSISSPTYFGTFLMGAARFDRSFVYRGGVGFQWRFSYLGISSKSQPFNVCLSNDFLMIIEQPSLTLVDTILEPFPEVSRAYPLANSTEAAPDIVLCLLSLINVEACRTVDNATNCLFNSCHQFDGQFHIGERACVDFNCTIQEQGFGQYVLANFSVGSPGTYQILFILGYNLKGKVLESAYVLSNSFEVLSSRPANASIFPQSPFPNITSLVTLESFSVVVHDSNGRPVSYAEQGIARSGSNTHIQLADISLGDFEDDDIYRGMILELTFGTGAGQVVVITNFFGKQRYAQAEFCIAPDNSTGYVIYYSMYVFPEYFLDDFSVCNGISCGFDGLSFSPVMNGTATFSTLRLKKAGTARLVFIVASIDLITPSFTILAGEPYDLVLMTAFNYHPLSIQANNTLPTIEVGASDSAGNSVDIGIMASRLELYLSQNQLSPTDPSSKLCFSKHSDALLFGNTMCHSSTTCLYTDLKITQTGSFRIQFRSWTSATQVDCIRDSQANVSSEARCLHTSVIASSIFSIIPGSACQPSMINQPISFSLNSTDEEDIVYLPIQPEIRLSDCFNNPINAAMYVTLLENGIVCTLNSSCSATLTGNKTVLNDDLGVVRYTNLGLQKAYFVYSLRFEVQDMKTVATQSESFSVSQYFRPLGLSGLVFRNLSGCVSFTNCTLMEDVLSMNQSPSCTCIVRIGGSLSATIHAVDSKGRTIDLSWINVGANITNLLLNHLIESQSAMTFNGSAIFDDIEFSTAGKFLISFFVVGAPFLNIDSPKENFRAAKFNVAVDEAPVQTRIPALKWVSFSENADTITNSSNEVVMFNGTAEVVLATLPLLSNNFQLSGLSLMINSCSESYDYFIVSGNIAIVQKPCNSTAGQSFACEPRFKLSATVAGATYAFDSAYGEVSVFSADCQNQEIAAGSNYNQLRTIGVLDPCENLTGTTTIFSSQGWINFTDLVLKRAGLYVLRFNFGCFGTAFLSPEIYIAPAHDCKIDGAHRNCNVIVKSQPPSNSTVSAGYELIYVVQIFDGFQNSLTHGNISATVSPCTCGDKKISSIFFSDKQALNMRGESVFLITFKKSCPSSMYTKIFGSYMQTECSGYSVTFTFLNNSVVSNRVFVEAESQAYNYSVQGLDTTAIAGRGILPFPSIEFYDRFGNLIISDQDAFSWSLSYRGVGMLPCKTYGLCATQSNNFSQSLSRDSTCNGSSAPTATGAHELSFYAPTAVANNVVLSLIFFHELRGIFDLNGIAVQLTITILAGPPASVELIHGKNIGSVFAGEIFRINASVFDEFKNSVRNISLLASLLRDDRLDFFNLTGCANCNEKSITGLMGQEYGLEVANFRLRITSVNDSKIFQVKISVCENLSWNGIFALTSPFAVRSANISQFEFSEIPATLEAGSLLWTRINFLDEFKNSVSLDDVPMEMAISSLDNGSAALFLGSACVCLQESGAFYTRSYNMSSCIPSSFISDRSFSSVEAAKYPAVNLTTLCQIAFNSYDSFIVLLLPIPLRKNPRCSFEVKPVVNGVKLSTAFSHSFVVQSRVSQILVIAQPSDVICSLLNQSARIFARALVLDIFSNPVEFGITIQTEFIGCLFSSYEAKTNSAGIVEVDFPLPNCLAFTCYGGVQILFSSFSGPYALTKNISLSVRIDQKEYFLRLIDTFPAVVSSSSLHMMKPIVQLCHAENLLISCALVSEWSGNVSVRLNGSNSNQTALLGKTLVQAFNGTAAFQDLGFADFVYGGIFNLIFSIPDTHYQTSSDDFEIVQSCWFTLSLQIEPLDIIAGSSISIRLSLVDVNNARVHRSQPDLQLIIKNCIDISCKSQNAYENMTVRMLDGNSAVSTTIYNVSRYSFQGFLYLPFDYLNLVVSNVIWINVVNNEPKYLRIVREPGNGYDKRPLGKQPVLHVTDAYNNLYITSCLNESLWVKVSTKTPLLGLLANSVQVQNGSAIFTNLTVILSDSNSCSNQSQENFMLDFNLFSNKGQIKNVSVTSTAFEVRIFTRLTQPNISWNLQSATGKEIFENVVFSSSISMTDNCDRIVDDLECIANVRLVGCCAILIGDNFSVVIQNGTFLFHNTISLVRCNSSNSITCGCARDCYLNFTVAGSGVYKLSDTFNVVQGGPNGTMVSFPLGDVISGLEIFPPLEITLMDSLGRLLLLPEKVHLELVPGYYMGNKLQVCPDLQCASSQAEVCGSDMCVCLSSVDGQDSNISVLGKVSFSHLSISHPGSGYRLRIYRCPVNTVSDWASKCSISVYTDPFDVKNTKIASIVRFLDASLGLTDIPAVILAGTAFSVAVRLVDSCGFLFASASELVEARLTNGVSLIKQQVLTETGFNSTISGQALFSNIHITKTGSWSMVIEVMNSTNTDPYFTIPLRSQVIQFQVLHSMPAQIKVTEPDPIISFAENAIFDITVKVFDEYDNPISFGQNLSQTYLQSLCQYSNIQQWLVWIPACNPYFMPLKMILVEVLLGPGCYDENCKSSSLAFLKGKLSSILDESFEARFYNLSFSATGFHFRFEFTSVVGTYPIISESSPFNVLSRELDSMLLSFCPVNSNNFYVVGSPLCTLSPESLESTCTQSRLMVSNVRDQNNIESFTGSALAVADLCVFSYGDMACGDNLFPPISLEGHSSVAFENGTATFNNLAVPQTPATNVVIRIRVIDPLAGRFLASYCPEISIIPGGLDKLQLSSPIPQQMIAGAPFLEPLKLNLLDKYNNSIRENFLVLVDACWSDDCTNIDTSILEYGRALSLDGTASFPDLLLKSTKISYLLFSATDKSTQKFTLRSQNISIFSCNPSQILLSQATSLISVVDTGDSICGGDCAVLSKDVYENENDNIDVSFSADIEPVVSQSSIEAVNPRCKCIGSNYPGYGNFFFDPFYGTSCQAWDAIRGNCSYLSSYCVPASWCCAFWCYVDASCPSAVPDVVIQGMYLSYETCSMDVNAVPTCPWKSNTTCMQRNAFSILESTLTPNGVSLSSRFAVSNRGSNFLGIFTDLYVTKPGYYMLSITAISNAKILSWKSQIFTVAPLNLAKAKLLYEPDNSSMYGSPLVNQPVVGLYDKYGNAISNHDFAKDGICTAVTATVASWKSQATINSVSASRSQVAYVFGQSVNDYTVYPVLYPVPCTSNSRSNKERCFITSQALNGVASFSWMHIGGGVADGIVLNFTIGCCSTEPGVCLCSDPNSPDPTVTYTNVVTQPCIWVASLPFSVQNPVARLLIKDQPSSSYFAGQLISVTACVLDAQNNILQGTEDEIFFATIYSLECNQSMLKSSDPPTACSNNTPASNAFSVNGIVTFSDLFVQTIPSGQRSVFFIHIRLEPNEISVDSTPFFVMPADPAKLWVLTGKKNMTAGSYLTAELTLVDRFDNILQYNESNLTCRVSIWSFIPAIESLCSSPLDGKLVSQYFHGRFFFF